MTIRVTTTKGTVVSGRWVYASTTGLLIGSSVDNHALVPYANIASIGGAEVSGLLNIESANAMLESTQGETMDYTLPHDFERLLAEEEEIERRLRVVSALSIEPSETCATCSEPIHKVVEPYTTYYVSDVDGDSLRYSPFLHDHRPEPYDMLP